jgi:hypothetical protein
MQVGCLVLRWDENSGKISKVLSDLHFFLSDPVLSANTKTTIFLISKKIETKTKMTTTNWKPCFVVALCLDSPFGASQEHPQRWIQMFQLFTRPLAQGGFGYSVMEAEKLYKNRARVICHELYDRGCPRYSHAPFAGLRGVL